MQYMADAVLYQRIDLTGAWSGWKLRGQYLVSPEGDRIMMRELVGMLVHYRAKFRHHRQRVRADALPSNVVRFPTPVGRVQGESPARRAERVV